MNTSKELILLTSVYTSDQSRWRVLRESAERCHAPLRVIGNDTDIFDVAQFISDRIAYLQAAESVTHVVLSDAFDVMVNRWDEREIVTAIDSAPGVICSVESNVWPAGPWETATAYERLGDRYLWKGICSGLIAGRRQDLIDLLEEMLERWHRGTVSQNGCCQEILHRLFANGRTALTLDLNCSLFQSMLGPHARQHIIPLVNGVAINTHTGSIPMLLHWNGQGLSVAGQAQVPPDMIEWDERRKTLTEEL